MRKLILGIFVLLVVISAKAQAPTDATDITAAQVQAFIKNGPHDRNNDRPIRVIDVGGYRAKAREALVQKAQAAAEKVRRWGDVVELEPMSAFDRRIIYNALKDAPGIEAASVEAEGTTH